MPFGLRGVERPHGEELARVVPLVERLRGVDPLVALEADEPAPQQLGQHLRDLGLPDAGLPFEQQRLVEREGEVDRGGEPAVRQVVVRREPGLELVDGARQRVGGVRRAHGAPCYGPEGFEG